MEHLSLQDSPVPKELPYILQQRLSIRQRRKMATTGMHLPSHNIASSSGPAEWSAVPNIIRELTDGNRLLDIGKQIDALN
jgi:hypothetical protein